MSCKALVFAFSIWPFRWKLNNKPQRKEHLIVVQTPLSLNSLLFEPRTADFGALLPPLMTWKTASISHLKLDKNLKVRPKEEHIWLYVVKVPIVSPDQAWQYAHHWWVSALYCRPWQSSLIQSTACPQEHQIESTSRLVAHLTKHIE